MITVTFLPDIPDWQRALVQRAIDHIDEYLVSESIPALDEARKCLGACRIMSILDTTSSPPVAGR